LLSIGGEGVISVVGNVIPQDMIQMTTSYLDGRVDEAQAWHLKLFPLCRDMLGLATNPIPIKAAMQMLGKDSGELRLPLTPLEEGQLQSLRTTLVDYGLLE
jgi:4-hydroxy-tetrahydrodipicolinate synthase